MMQKQTQNVELLSIAVFYLWKREMLLIKLFVHLRRERVASGSDDF